VLSDLTTAEFALLIASKQLLNRDREVFNFEMCFDEVKKFVAKIEMDRMGASANSISTTHTPDTARRRAIGAAASTATLGWQGLTNRKRVMMAFQSLLQLELFQPEVSLKDLSLAGPATSLVAKGAQTVRNEYLRVKCTIFAQDIIDAARNPNRTEALGTHLIQWATSNG
jgi:origin recognition complex subunit 4